VTAQVRRLYLHIARDGLAVMLLLIGLVPLAGLALLGRWPEWELGAGVAMSLFALRQLASPNPGTGVQYER
jgi:hypothetical protein